ncbi:MAG TPA: hypothetical protein DDW52_04535 [Planctomycetaceae bacterium]|nr:hypothetical protein [Planctomycetaceae bacterium]
MAYGASAIRAPARDLANRPKKLKALQTELIRLKLASTGSAEHCSALELSSHKRMTTLQTQLLRLRKNRLRSSLWKSERKKPTSL